MPIHRRPPLVFPARKNHTATLLFLHGLGDSGEGWSFLADTLQPQLPHVKFVFPHAPRRPITINGGMAMPGWYDLVSLDERNPVHDEAGIMETVDHISSLIKEETDAGISSKRIVLGGFSQGAAVTLISNLVLETKLAGFIGLSGYLPLDKKAAEIAKPTNQWAPLFMGNGDEDQVVAYHWGKSSAEKMKELGRQTTFKTYRGLGHSANDQELSDVLKFLKEVIPENVSSD
ncbi:Phospholipase/carboxylesterase/thioesterase [Zopfochytrium polystomum]|nr:Phospholipase/carboxylesterase/thioesterase [Zopfochytrium polystomum]